jgi:hypothetical protein
MSTFVPDHPSYLFVHVAPCLRLFADDRSENVSRFSRKPATSSPATSSWAHRELGALREICVFELIGCSDKPKRRGVAQRDARCEVRGVEGQV